MESLTADISLVGSCCRLAGHRLGSLLRCCADLSRQCRQHKFVLDPRFKDRCEVEGEDLNTLSNLLTHLMAEARAREL